MAALPMIRSQVMHRWAFAVMCGAVGLMLGRGAQGQVQQAADVDHLMQNLATASDFRIRTQAALALGASKSARAVAPLCGGLADNNATVRAASAAALGRLRLGGADCLQKRLVSESVESVRGAIQKALDPVFSSATKFYLAIGKTADKTGRTGDEVDALLHEAMVHAASAQPTFTVAPVGETLSDAKRRLAGRAGVKSYFLSPRLTPPEYTGGNLTIRLEIAMFSYPDKALIGNYTTKLTAPGVSPSDRDTENELIETAGERALDKFSQIVLRLP